MGIPTREDLLRASNIKTREIELPDLGFSVKIRSLPAAYSNMASSEALRRVESIDAKGRLELTTHIDTVKLEELQVLHGLVDPKLNSIEDARTFSMNVTAEVWKFLVGEIVSFSQLDAKSAEDVEELFRDGGRSETRELDSGSPDHSADEQTEAPIADGDRNGGSAVPVRAGA